MRRKIVIAGVVLLAAAVGGAIYWFRRPQAVHREPALRPAPEAPPDLARFRDEFAAGVAALERGDGEDAVAHLSSFRFGSRAVEEYRLYYLANGHMLRGDLTQARRALAMLWAGEPRFVYREDAGFHLASLYRDAGDWNRAARVLVRTAARGETAAASGTARWEAALCRFAEGDLAGFLQNAREVVIRSPRSQPADSAVAAVRALSGDTLPLTPHERYERAVALLRDGDPAASLEELDLLAREAPPSLSLPVRLQRGLALHRLRRYRESNELLEPLAGSYFKYAVPAIHYAAKNYRALAASIDPVVRKTVSEKKRAGSVRVRVGKGKNRRTVLRPKYVTVTRTLERVDPEKKRKKEEYGRLASERLKDLLLLPLSDDLRIEVLDTLIGLAVAKNQDDYAKKLVSDLVKLDPGADPALQYFWDKGWAAYLRGDHATARGFFRYIAQTYRNPNVRRQADYWYARAAERSGDRQEASTIYRRLAAAPYADLYAHHAIARGAPPGQPKTNPLREKGPDWARIAEETMPSELRLAWELTSLAQTKDARMEVQKNIHRGNRKYANAILADLYAAAGSHFLMYRALRIAFPELATVEQDSVPPYFLKMYYPRRYEEPIERNARKNELDPNLVKALILQESYYNPAARSPVGATGLMQIMPPTGRELARMLHGRFSNPDLEDPEENIELGTLHLRRLIALFGGNVHLAVASYNAGQGNVLRWRRAAPGRPLDEFLESIPFPETRNYVKRVTMLRSSYERLSR
ncbi:MAG TPA: transglycosylase SLT domain-containing protein [Thermoanaerobaculia bacterium]|nr:transglycosylase SLT domain-containing protein [Thermoanaerobaculia bacterium]